MSMGLKAPVLTPPPQLPNELYRNIIEYLLHFRERNTLLLCLALVCKAWCAESQRLLFRTFCDDATDMVCMDNLESRIHMHTLFLEAIILSPTRLGPYVQTYKQHELICHPVLAAGPTLPSAKASSYLWDLTSKALPALVNLKHLFIVPIHDDCRTPRASLLEGCTFQLKTLRWGFEPSHRSSTDAFVAFLRTQHNLLHLEVGSDPLGQDLSWLPDDACPSMKSASCQLDAVARMVGRRNVVGLAVWSDWHLAQATPQHHLIALRRLKYLSLSGHGDLLSNWGALDSHTILLELTSWDLRTIRRLPDLPNLRVLALVRVPRRAVRARFLGDWQMDSKAENNLRTHLATESFRRCPNLEYVIVEEVARGEEQRRFRKLSLTGSRPGHDTTPDIQSEEFPIHREFGKPWWTAYGV
ncbi:hypothetical protein D9619_004432 [Psilocybe cf. subviscida]|uniref:F-box domain-containing protein n=1 Tax=Psilocybe cf. subviscida TaxID=2480587 RepID=A0A8H5F895_9AGAR|nr:hypothetical protein D9619_004432 [Psilocybe cf. subviscida]